MTDPLTLPGISATPGSLRKTRRARRTTANLRHAAPDATSGTHGSSTGVQVRLAATPIRRWAIALAVAASLISLAACGGGGGSTTKAPSGLVEDQLGFGQEALIERQSRIEAAISDCMKAQGFQYVPIDPLAQRAAVTGSTRLSDEGFLKQFGYGISTLSGRGTPQNDPNEQIRASLSGAGSAAYERALWSENPGATFSQAIETGDFERLGGCTKKATEAIFGGPETLTALQSKLDDLDQRIVQDQRMVRAIEQWVGCMTSAGYSISDPQDVDATITERFQAVVGRSVEP